MLCLKDQHGFHLFDDIEDAQWYILLRDFPGIKGDVVVDGQKIHIRITAERPVTLLDAKSGKPKVQLVPKFHTSDTLCT